MLNNTRGYKSKEIMIKRIIGEEEPVLVALVETKLNKNDKVEIPGYEEPLRVDRDEDGGGVLLTYKKCLTNIVIGTTEIRLHNAEMLWAKMDNGKVKVKIGVIYMPQESRTTLLKLQEIYEKMEEEIIEAQQKGNKILILGDLNCKVGAAIEGNNEEVSKGGRLLLKMLKKFKLKLVNAETCCEGLWTRKEGESKSVLDYVIVSEEDLDLVERMEIDEEKDITPYYVEKVGGKDVRQYTDHCMIKTEMNISMEAKQGKKYAYVLDEDACERFRKKLEEEKVSELITNEEDIRTTYQAWSEKIIQVRDSCSKRVKIQKKWKVCRKLTAAKKRITRELKTTTDKKQIKELKDRKEIIKQQIEQEEHKKENTRINKIVADVKRAGGVNSNTFWNVRRRLNPKGNDQAHAMMNKEGVLCEKVEDIKQIHTEWFKELLQTKAGQSKVERQAEEIVKMVWDSMEMIAKHQPPRITTNEEVEKIVRNLDPKKAKDSETWKNNIIKEGGTEMIKSLTKITNQVDRQRLIPHEWQKMEIRAIHKTGARYSMGNKRGLFLTNNVSKIYEKIVKERNSDDFTEGISEWHTGGVSERSTVDTMMTMTAVIEQNIYLRQNTYLTFTDAEKCFDKLWLLDGVCELWRCGTDVRDCVMIKKLNERAEVVVKTPVGDTEPFHLTDIVRQGSVYGPQICVASMDKINKMGKDIGTYYSPDLIIRAGIYIDDVTAGGGVNTANSTVYNCSLMEEKKKMSFNNKPGKTEYMVIGRFKEEVKTVNNEVRKGLINRVKEHKMLGTWVDESGKYEININKKKEKLPYMISTTKKDASPKTVGIYTVESRLKLAETVIIPSILNDIEGFPVLKGAEIKKLESMQLNILTDILELPRSTPYCALLMEVGWWPMKARIAYKKLMLYHNIMRSGKKRVARKLVIEQEKEARKTTWLASVKEEIEIYKISLNVMETLKSTWKREVKKQINKEVEEEIRQLCVTSKKSRVVRNDNYEAKEYLKGAVNLQTAKKILRTRLNMAWLPGNYKKDGKGLCPLCEEEEGSTEHYFHCKHVSLLAKVWQVTPEDLGSQEVSKMKDVARFFEKVEIMINPERTTR